MAVRSGAVTLKPLADVQNISPTTTLSPRQRQGIPNKMAVAVNQVDAAIAKKKASYLVSTRCGDLEKIQGSITINSY